MSVVVKDSFHVHPIKLTGEKSMCPSCGANLYCDEITYKEQVYWVIRCHPCKTPSAYWKDRFTYVRKLHYNIQEGD